MVPDIKFFISSQMYIYEVNRQDQFIILQIIIIVHLWPKALKAKEQAHL